MTTRSLPTGILRSYVTIAVVAVVVQTAAIAPRTACAEWTANGLAVAPSDTDQIEVATTPDGAGGVLICWESQSGSVNSTDMTRLTSSGNVAPGWPVHAMLGTIPYNGVTLAPDAAGGAYIASTGCCPNVVLTRITGDGTVASGWPGSGISFTNSLSGPFPSTTPLDNSPPGALRGHETYFPEVVPDGAGGVVAAWTHLLGNANDEAHFTRMTGSGGFQTGWTVHGFAVTGYYSDRIDACVDPLGGVFATYAYVVFLSNSYHVRVGIEHVSADGTPLAVAPVSSDSTNVQDLPGVVTDGTGGALVFWQDDRGAPQHQIYCQHVLGNGAYAPGWPAAGLPICSAATNAGTTSFYDPVTPYFRESAVSDGSGGAYVAWTDHRSDSAAGDIYAQHVLGDGSIASGWPVDGLAVCTAPGDQQRPTVAADGAGGLLVSWQDGRSDAGDIYAQHIDATGALAPSWPAGGIAVCTAEGSQVLPRIVNDDAGGTIVAWEDHRGSVPQIYASHVTYDGVVPTLAALASLEATSERVNIVWFAGSSGGPITIERNAQGSGWIAIASVRADAAGRISYEDRDVVPGSRYGYRLGLMSNGGEIRVGETWVTVPGAAFTLQPIRPNPIPAGALAVTFAVPAPGRVSLDVLDVGGRRVASRQINASHAGSFTEALGEFAVLPTGMYVIRLSQAGRSAAERACVVH